MLKKTILFDMDGVTINTEPLYTQAEKKLLNEYNINVSEDELHLFRGSSEIDFYKQCINKYKIKENINIFIKKGRKYVKNEFEQDIPFIPGFKSLIKRISDDYVTGLVTASPIKIFKYIYNKNNLKKYFNYSMSGEETQKNKPFPDPYIHMIRKIDTLPSHTIIIEDSIVGIKAALASGAHVIALEGSVPKQKLQIAHNIVSHLDEITLEFIENIFKSNN